VPVKWKARAIILSQEKNFRERSITMSFWNLQNGNFYGTPRAEVEKKLAAGSDVILEIDIQGALNVQENTTEGIFIFILPPSMNELKKRIIGRGSETPESLLTRFKSAYNEINYVSKYNYAITNHTVEQAYSDLMCIVRAERCRVTRVTNEILTLKEEEL